VPALARSPVRACPALGCAIALGCTLLLASGPATAYVRTRSTDTNAAFFWSRPQVTLEVARPADSFELAAGDVRGAALAAVGAWSAPAVDCTSLVLSLAPGFADGQVVAFDGHNRIIIRSDGWSCEPGATTRCHDQSVVALTTVFSRSKPGSLADGEILEADIEVNDVGYEWAVIPDGPISVRDYESSYDLTSALTHEVGHFIGLAHDCLLPADGARVDDQGIVSPECATVSADAAPQILGATMYPIMSPADISWRSLSSDDTRAVCALYSRDAEPVTGWCAVAARPAGGQGGATTPSETAAAVLAALGAWVSSRRRRRSR
jgi:hypothetical protein